VGALLEGSIRKDGNRLRISAQLIKTEDGSRLWSESYDRKLEDIFTIQDEISLAVVDNLKIKLLGDERAAVLKRYTDDFEVYNLYLRALSNLQLATPDGFEKAMDFIRQALKIDPLFVPGYNGLAEIYILSSFFDKVPPNTGYPKAKEYAEKALDMDDTHPDAHRIMGVVNTYYHWEWDAAARYLEHACKINPGNEWVHYSYSLFLTFMGRHSEAIGEIKRAVELDPLSGYFSAFLGHIYLFDHQYEQAINQLKQTVSTFPNLYMGHWFLGTSYRYALQMDEAIAAFRKAVELSNDIPMVVASLANVLYETGNTKEAENLINSLELRSEKEYVPASCFIPYYLLRGDHDRAVSWVKRAIREHDGYLLFFAVFPVKEYRIPDAPEYAGLMKKVGLPLHL
jgi:tetratricopeptide (TPR) repeat protein